MKNTISFILLVLFCNFSNASNTSLKKHWNINKHKIVTLAEIQTDKSYFNLSGLDQLKLKNTTKDNLGFTHYTYTQTHKNIPVENTTITIHEKDGRVYIANGSTAHHFEQNEVASIDEVTALNIALGQVDADLYAWEVPEYEQALCKVSKDKFTFYPKGELVWYKSTNSKIEDPFKITYKFDVYSIKPNARQYIYVNAQTGVVIEKVNRIANCTHTLVTGETNYYDTVNLSACEKNGTYHLKNIDNTHIEIFDAKQTRFTYQNEITDTDNHFENNKSANEVFWAAQNIYKYFKETFDRNSIDDEGMPILSWVNYANEAGNKNDVFWNGNWMSFGSGDGKSYNSRTSCDIVAHELMHGINDFTANLLYANESGALEESFSDIFGEIIEAYINGSNDWLIGAETIADSSKTALRSLSNPKDGSIFYQQPNTYKGENWWISKEDNGGVHYNSGVQNYWFYLLTEGGSGVNDNGYSYNIEPIGIDKAAAIAYRNLAYYLTRYSNFEDAKNGAIQAATDLFGADSNATKQTALAWRAVGIGQQNDKPQPGIEPTLNDNIDSIALINLYNATNLDNTWVNDWDLTKPMNEWHGVTINEFRNVIKLELPANGLSGEITSELKIMSGNLEVLNLANNQLNGLFPQLSLVYRLFELNLSNNNLDGQLPNLGNLYNLKLLNLSNNNFYGSIFIRNYSSSALVTLNLSNNKLTGNISFTIAHLPNIEHLYLNNNLFTGKLLSDLAVIPNLKTLHLQNNLFSGCISNKYGKFCNNDNGVDFDMSGNNLPFSISEFCMYEDSGCWGPEAMACRVTDSLNLYVLLDYIDREGWEKTKPIKDWWGITRNADGCVVRIHIGEDDTGTLPPEIGNFKHLEIISTDESSLTGPIPPEIGLLNNLRVLDLSESNFIGEVPPEIVNLQQVESIYLNENRLTGSISFLENMPLVNYCNLSYNNFSGPFSLEIAREKNISINNNHFFGCYPAEALNLCDKYSDYRISNSNNFDVSWSEFCNEGAQACASSLPCRTKDSLTLVKIHQSLINNVEDYSFWNFDTPINTWNGITLNEFGCVSELKFFEDPVFYGSLPPEIGDLQNLETLIVYDCFLPGEIPIEIGNLPLLTTLNLQWNELSGEIPTEIGNLSLLNTLNLEDNQLSGEIPGELSNNYYLETLNLSSNNLSGEIPKNIGYRSRLKNLNLSNNNLTGSLPYTFGNLKNIEDLNVTYNQLTADCFSSDLKKICSAEVKLIGSNTNIEQNSFSATWDDFCSNNEAMCTPCRYTDSLTLVTIHESLKGENGEDFWDFENSMYWESSIDNWDGVSLNEEGCVKNIQLGGAQNYIDLTGSLPPEIGDLHSLESLSLTYLGIDGIIPKEIGNLSNLEFLFLDANNFEGTIPEELINLNKLVILDLSDNELQGNIPLNIGELSKLKVLAFDHNNLDGQLPASISNLTRLIEISIQNNNLSGCFAPEFKTLCYRFLSEKIDPGNNFDANWDNFCESDIGSCSYYETCRQTDSLTLLKIHKHLKRNGNDFWNLNTPIDTWNGITLDENGCVVGFQFGPQDNLSFNTSLPAEIGDLKSLETLHLSSCNLTGKIPVEIANLTELDFLTLSNNQFEGNIPEELAQLKNMNALMLGRNNLEGSIPSYIGEFDNLGWLELNDNQLTGNIPASFGNLEISILNIGNNNLSGCYASKLNKLCDQLDADPFLNVVDIGNNFDATWDDFCNSSAGVCQEIVTCRQTDSLTLIKIHEHLKGNGNDFWDLNTPIDTWEGIELNETGCVKWFQFGPQHNLNFNTTLPVEIADLKNLELLHLVSCNLTGEIPKEIANLTELEILSLNNNKLQGNIPQELSQLKKLNVLTLGNNNLQGNIPYYIGQLEYLSWLELNDNQLMGAIPASFATSILQIVNIGNNNLSGCYAPELSKLCNQLDTDEFHRNIDTGNNFNATWDDFCNTGVGACIETVSTCRQTDSLTLTKIHEHLKGNGVDFWDLNTPIDKWTGIKLNEEGCVAEILLSGDFNTNLPGEIGDLQSLIFIAIGGNLTGEIPKELGNLSNLDILDLSGNNIEGTIPVELSQIKSLTVLMLSNNNLKGEIPFHIGNFENLGWLELHNNQFTGNIPASFANLPLFTVNIGNNNLSGCYERQLNKLCDQFDENWQSIISEGNNFNATWDDFCNTDTGTCNEGNKTATVWPGDMDNNGVVNSNDLLYYGLAAGKTGAERTNATTNWQSQESSNWNSVVGGVNCAYQDADGNGTIDKLDVTAVINNYGKTHKIEEYVNISGQVNLKLKLASSVKYEETLELIYELYAKNDDGSDPNIYGLSGNINFSDFAVKEISTDFSESSLQPDEHFWFYENSTGILDLSLTRTNKVNISVDKPVAKIIVIIDDMPTGDPPLIQVNGGSFTTVNGGLNGIKSSSFYGNYNNGPSINTALQLYVNTTNDQCYSKGSANVTIEGGLAPYTIKWSNGSTAELNSNLEPGAYSVYITDAVGSVAQVDFIIYSTPPVYNQNGTLICGTTCPDYLLPTTTRSNKVYQSAQVLNANCVFTENQTIEFNAGDTITLDKGFYIGKGVGFSAKIQQCE